MRADGASPYYAQPQAERPRRERLVSDTTLSIESRVRLDQTSLVGRARATSRSEIIFICNEVLTDASDVTAHFTPVTASR
jgi:hypothetical protein